MRHWPVGVAFGLLASSCLLALEASRHIKVKLLDWVLLGYFVLAAIAMFGVHSATFPVYSSVIIWILYAGLDPVGSAVHPAICPRIRAPRALAEPWIYSRQPAHQPGLGHRVRRQHRAGDDRAKPSRLSSAQRRRGSASHHGSRLDFHLPLYENDPRAGPAILSADLTRPAAFSAPSFWYAVEFSSPTRLLLMRKVRNWLSIL